MKLSLIFVTTFSLALVSLVTGNSLSDSEQIKQLNYQVMMLQLGNQEQLHSDGNSGVKTKRRRFEGTKSYHQTTFNDINYIDIHDHADFERTPGLGEFEAVLNGVHFKTRHNDYGLNMPHRTNKSYHATEKIPFPEVPPSVLNKSSVAAEIEEMKEYLLAWKELNISRRDYKPYFKSALCYLEGAWIIPENDTIEEPFHSQRHIIEAKTWMELAKKEKMAQDAGRKSPRENFAFLPTRIIDIKNDSTPVYAQWSYRILCYPTKHLVDHDRFYYVDDLPSRMSFDRKISNANTSRTARFKLNYKNRPSDELVHGHITESSFLDYLMSQIPGKDNGKGYINDNLYGSTAQKRSSSDKLNVARYHRYFKSPVKTANGNYDDARGFYDVTAYYAMTTQPKIAGHTMGSDCKIADGKHVCKEFYEQKWTFAIPLEIVYLTPLLKWNPFKIAYDEYGDQCDQCTGGFTDVTAYNKATNRHYYLTPSAFFTGSSPDNFAADTSSGSRGILDPENNVRSVVATGIRTILPEIPGIVGRLRTRYPIAPVHQYGSHYTKMIEALADLLIDEKRTLNRLREEFKLPTLV